MPLCICAFTTSGVTAIPHSTAPAALHLREGLIPARLLGGELQRRDVSRTRAEKAQAEGDGILAGRLCQLVDHHFLGEGRVGVLDRPPPQYRHADFRGVPADVPV